MDKLLRKLVSILLIITLTGANLSILGMYGIAYAVSDMELSEQSTVTQNKNVEFNAFFEGGGHTRTELTDSTDARLFLNIKVKNSGYLKNAEIVFNNANFKIREELTDSNVESTDIENNKILLKQINNGSDVTIEVPISILNNDEVLPDNFNKVSTTSFSGMYVDAKGEQNLVSKEISNKLSWNAMVQIALKTEMTKYVPFILEGKSGVMMQAKIQSGIEENKLPIKSTNIEVQVPQINGIMPTSIAVLANSIKATNGGENGIDFTEQNYVYNNETGIVTISMNNKSDMVSWLKGVQDEYLVTFIFEGQEMYEYANMNGIQVNSQVHSTIEVYNGNQTILDKTEIMQFTGKQKMGDIEDVNIELPQRVSKGYMYSNYSSEIKNETPYEVKYTATVNSASLTEKMELIQKADRFVNAEGIEIPTEIAGSQCVYNKVIKINESIFDKILGMDGVIEVYNIDGITKLGEITKDTERDERGNYFIDISDKNNSQLIFRTSKPITEGNLIIYIEKAIKSNISYAEKQVQTFKGLISEIEEKTNTSSVVAKMQMMLEEPTSVAEVTVNKTDLTTVVENENVEIRAVLNTSTEYNALYKNPTLKIKLPDSISRVELNKIDVIMANGLSIKGIPEIKMENGVPVINVKLEGMQKDYTIDAEYKGTIVVLNTDITLKELTPTSASKIEMTFTNENGVSINKQGVVYADVNLVAPAGVVAANGISNYAEGKADIMSISDESKVVEIPTNSKEITSTIEGKIINNYENGVKGITILGRFPSQDNTKIDKDEDLSSTFSTKLKSGLKLTGIDESKYAIYYSNNEKATADLTDINNGWTNKAIEGAKSYLVVTTDYEMASGEQLGFSYDVTIPKNLTHNNNTSEMYKVYYDNMSPIGLMEESKESPILTMSTGQGPDLTAQLQSTADVIREGQIVKMKATIKNTGNVIAKNVKVNVPLPRYATFMEYSTGDGFYTTEEKTKVINIGELGVGKSTEISYYVKIADNTKYTSSSENKTEQEKQSIQDANSFPKEVVNTINITADDLANPISSNEYKFNVQEGKIFLSLISNISEDQVLKKGDIINYTLNITNISMEGSLSDTNVTLPLPNGLKYKDAIIKDSWSSENESKDGISYDSSANAVKVNLGTLDMSKLIIVDAEVEDVSGVITTVATAKASGTEEHYSNTLEYNANKADLDISELTATPKYVKEGEIITYKFRITNKGKSIETNIKISDELPAELTFVDASYTYAGKKQTVSTLTNNKVELTINQLEAGSVTDIEIRAKTGLLSDKQDKEISNKVIVQTSNNWESQTNTVTNVIEYYESIHEQLIQQGGTSGGSGNNGSQAQGNYKITGIAWIDENQNGKRDENEQTVSGVSVMLLNKNTNSIVKDISTNQDKSVLTGSDGKYEFGNLTPGEYFAIFLYDSARYSLTKYQAKDVDASLNSDAIDINMNVDGKRTIAGITDAIKITNSNIRDIDIGLYTSEKFDLKIDKYISKVTLSTPTIGTKTTDYNNKKIAKVEVAGKNFGKSSAVIEYKIVVTNDGAVPGYARKVVDYLPEGSSFSTDMNESWYLSENGNVYNSSLANDKINPGESRVLTLVLTKKITESSIGVLNNNAEIYEAYNELGLKDMDSTPANAVETEDDMSQADVVISLTTGGGIMYITLGLGILVLLGFGAYEVKRRVLKKRK